MKTLEHRRTCILHLYFINPYSAIIPSSFMNFLVKKKNLKRENYVVSYRYNYFLTTTDLPRTMKIIYLIPY